MALTTSPRTETGLAMDRYEKNSPSPGSYPSSLIFLTISQSLKDLQQDSQDKRLEFANSIVYKELTGGTRGFI